MSFCTAVNCMDGRVQLPVIQFLQKRFGAEYVDSITEPGPNAILARGEDAATIDSIIKRLNVSVHHHKSKAIAVAGHYDCAGNPVGKDQQNSDTRAAVAVLRNSFPEVTIIGLWVDESWQVRVI